MVRSRPLLLLFIFLLAFSLRIWFIASYSNHLEADEVEYDRLAISLIKGDGYVNKTGLPTAIRPPGYPLFLSLFYLALGKDYFILRVTQAVLGSLLCLLVYFLGKGMFSPGTGLISAFLCAIHLGFICLPEKILTEGLCTVILFLGVIFLTLAIKGAHQARDYFLAGLFLGLASLVRSNLLIVFCLLFAFLIYRLVRRSGSLRKDIKYPLICLAAFLISIMPWVIRNSLVFHEITPFSTANGIALYSAYKPVNEKVYGNVTKDEITKQSQILTSEAAQSRFLTREAFKLFKNDHWLFFKLLGLKMSYLFSPFDWEIIPGKAVFNYLYVFYFPFFLAGFFLFWRRLPELASLYIPILGVVMTAVIYFGIPRFRVPFEPYMIILASAAIYHIYKKVSNQAGFLIVLLILFSFNLTLFFYSDSIKQASKVFLQGRGLW